MLENITENKYQNLRLTTHNAVWWPFNEVLTDKVSRESF